jgi:hypothetical protein
MPHEHAVAREEVRPADEDGTPVDEGGPVERRAAMHERRPAEVPRRTEVADTRSAHMADPRSAHMNAAAAEMPAVAFLSERRCGRERKHRRDSRNE